MKIECRLRKLLMDNGLDRHGVIGDIAAYVKVHRQTVANLYKGKAEVINLEVLGKLVDWLVDEGVPATSLPGALIGPGALWDRIGLSRKVMVYIGEYESGGLRKLARSMISRHDAEVATNIVRAMSRHGQLHDVDISYVPFQIASETPFSIREEDKERAKTTFERMRSREQTHTSVFLIGSQKVNLITEQLVASCFDCQPFVPHQRQFRVPFFVLYRDQDPAISSCFGGRTLPKSLNMQGPPGVYYQTGPNKWDGIAYDEEKHQDAAIVVVSNDPGRSALEIALIGFSSIGTAGVGEHFLKKADDFWPPPARRAGRQLGVYICKFTRDPEITDQVKLKCEVIAMPAKLLQNKGE